MNTNVAHVNLLFAWLWILLGFGSGLVLGLRFHQENWLGGYGSLRRRLYRLAHISFFGLGAVNLLFWLTAQKALPPTAPGVTVASWAFIAGGVTMPLGCLLMARWPQMRLLFAVPIVCLLVGGAVTLRLAVTGTAAAARPARFELNRWGAGDDTHGQAARSTLLLPTNPATPSSPRPRMLL